MAEAMARGLASGVELWDADLLDLGFDADDVIHLRGLAGSEAQARHRHLCAAIRIVAASLGPVFAGQVQP